MEELREAIQAQVEAEYWRASEKFGVVNASDHESYAVIKEELEEFEDEIKLVKYQFDKFWENVKADDSPAVKLHCLELAEGYAVSAACELIQMAAMLHKASITTDAKERRRKTQ